jgi:hypothetical protein
MRLVGQPVDQVYRHGDKPDRPRLGDEPQRVLDLLHPVDGPLHPGIEILNPHTQAVESHFRQQRQRLRPRRPGIDLQRVLPFPIPDQSETLGQAGHQRRHLFVAQIRRRSTAQVQLGDRSVPIV